VPGERLTPSFETVRAEMAWLRRLAGALTRDDDQADDAVQETWLARLAHPPPQGGALGGWLSTVLRNAVRKRGRSSARRQAREHEAQARAALAVPDAEELALRLEAQRLVGELVLALDEPFRSTLLLRFHEGLAPSEIARRQGLPAGTVRWRLKTGLDRVRRDLERTHTGRWRRLLVPLGAPRRAWLAPWKGILAMKATSKGALLGLLLLLGLLAGGRWLAKREAPATIAAAPRSSRVGEATSAAPATREPRAFGIYRRGARTTVPRFLPVATAPDAAAPRLVTPPPRLEPAGDKPPRSRLEKDPPNLARMQSKVMAVLEDMNARADRCLEGWSAADPALQKGVMVGIEMDRMGLTRVWIDDLVEIPQGPLACLSNAVYSLDWSGITEQPLMLTVKQRYQSADAGAP
jgi:RNA polymerase sigma-70 factor (ECF subfamily)